MGSRVQYRDLPGGPGELTFCDELTRHSLCTNCNMLSMSMLQDTNRHMFCETCLNETSEKHHREHIYCKYENKQVSIFEMFDAHALITVIRDQYVICPYQDCKSAVTLVQLKDHYMACHPTVTCSTCKQQVQTAEWSNHSKDCRERGAYKTPPKATIPKQIQHKDALLPPNSSPSVRMDSYLNNGRTFEPMYPSSDLQQAQKATDDGSDKIMLCQHCEKKVKERNMPQHLDKCLKVPQLCAYCEKEFSKEKIKSHLAVCTANPGNIPEQPPERKRESPNPKAASPPEAQGNPPASYAAVVKDGKRAGGNTSTSATTRSAGARQKTTAQGPTAPAKGASKSRTDAEQGEVPADSPVWLQYLSSGDLLAAFAAFEESFSGKKMDEHFLYTQFITAFVDTNSREMVKDVLEKPCSTRPLDNLMAALFARVLLPRNIWAKGTQKVTWDDVLKYLPSVLASRLKQRKAMSCLRKYPVFMDERGTSNVVETSCAAEHHPPTASHSSNSTNPVAPRTDVADPPANAKDEQDASEVVKDNNMDGGQPTREEKSSLPAGEKSLHQPVAKVELELTEREKCHDGEKRPQRGPKTRGKEAGAPPSRSIEYTQKEPTRDQIQPDSDQAGFATTPSRLDTETPGEKGGVYIFNPPRSTACQLDSTHEQKSLEELGALLILEGHSKPDVESLKCKTCGRDAISLGSADVGDFSHTAANKGTAPKAESYCTSLDNSSLKGGKELTSELQSQNDHALNVTLEDSQLSTAQGGSLRSAAEGPMQADHFHISARAVYPIEAEVLHGDRHDSTGRKTQSANNKPLLEHEHQTTGNGHSESTGPEKEPKSTKCKTCPSEATPSRSADENNFIYAATNIEKAPEAGNASSSVGDSALREDREFLAPQRHCRSDHASNVTCKERELSTRLKANFRSPTERTMQADDFTNAAHVVSSTKAHALLVQKPGSTKHATSSTKKERFWELTHQARTEQKSYVSDSAPLTANAMPQYSRCEITNTGRVPALRAAFEPSPPEPQCLQTRSESVGSINNVTAKEEMSSDAENEPYFTGSKPHLEDDEVASKFSRLSISHESHEKRTTLTSDQSTY